MTRQERAAALAAEVREVGWTLEFVQVSPRGSVHVVGPDSDQPRYTSIADMLMCYRFRTVCGATVTLVPPEGGTIWWQWADERLCWGCGDAFTTDDDRALIFEHNTAERQAATNNECIRRDRRAEAADQRVTFTQGGQQ